MTSGSSGLRQRLLDPRGITGARWDSWVLRDQRAGHLDAWVPGEPGKRNVEPRSEGRTLETGSPGSQEEHLRI